MSDQTKDSDRARQADQAKHHARHPDHENFLAQGGFVAVDIRAEIARLKREPAWASGDRHCWLAGEIRRIPTERTG